MRRAFFFLREDLLQDFFFLGRSTEQGWCRRAVRKKMQATAALPHRNSILGQHGCQAGASDRNGRCTSIPAVFGKLPAFGKSTNMLQFLSNLRQVRVEEEEKEGIRGRGEKEKCVLVRPEGEVPDGENDEGGNRRACRLKERDTYPALQRPLANV